MSNGNIDSVIIIGQNGEVYWNQDNAGTGELIKIGEIFKNKNFDFFKVNISILNF